MSIVKMSNQEIYETYIKLKNFQAYEKEYYAKKSERLLKGRVRISYAIEKNLESLAKALKPRDETIEKIFEEYRDLKAEKYALEAESKLAKEQNRSMNPIEDIFLDGKSKEDYYKELKELSNIEAEVDIHKIKFDLFEGIELDSSELNIFMFMLEE